MRITRVVCILYAYYVCVHNTLLEYVVVCIIIIHTTLVV